MTNKITPSERIVVSITEMPFIHASRFAHENISIEVYDKLERMNSENKDTYVSVYRLYQNWQEVEPGDKPWFVVLQGETPPEPLAKEMLQTLRRGEIAMVPDEVIALFAARRVEFTETYTETEDAYVERHYEPN
jgi:hypothetical protein